MDSQNNKELADISLVLFFQGKKVFTGTIDEIHEFESNDQTADHAKLFGDNGSAVVSMPYKELFKLF